MSALPAKGQCIWVQWEVENDSQGFDLKWYESEVLTVNDYRPRQQSRDIDSLAHGSILYKVSSDSPDVHLHYVRFLSDNRLRATFAVFNGVSVNHVYPKSFP